MKVIDLLNMIAKGEDVPKKILYRNTIYDWDETGYMHFEDNIREIAFLEGLRTDMVLNDKIEIIEENKEIEHQDMFDFFTGYDFKGTNKELLQHLEINFTIINKELSELVDEVNKLKSND